MRKKLKPEALLAEQERALRRKAKQEAEMAKNRAEAYARYLAACERHKQTSEAEAQD